VEKFLPLGQGVKRILRFAQDDKAAQDDKLVLDDKFIQDARAESA